MHPTALVQTLMDVISAVEITAEHSLKVLPDQSFDHLSPARMMVLVIADTRRRDAPDVAVEPIFPPSGFICLHCRTGADSAFQRVQLGLQVVLEPMQHLYDLSDADREPVKGLHVHLDLPNGQTHHRAQGSNHTGEPHANAPLAYHLLLHIHRSLMPFLTSCTPTLVDLMMAHLHRCWRGNINDLSHTRKADAPQTQSTGWAIHYTMFDDRGWG